jgi:hypothetical protein
MHNNTLGQPDSLSPCLPISLSLPQPDSLSPCLPVSLSLPQPDSLSPCLPVSLSLPLPAQDLRTNIGTWAVSDHQLPALAYALTSASGGLPTEKFDPRFLGQRLETTYLDTRDFVLRKARVKGDKYLTLRIRCYSAEGGSGMYALSAKTEFGKYRLTLESNAAEDILANGFGQQFWNLLPSDLIARLMDLAGEDVPVPVVAVCFKRYTVENDTDRLTLDIDIHTDTGKQLPFNVLEYKTTADKPTWPFYVTTLRPIKLSKFLWSTCP